MPELIHVGFHKQLYQTQIGFSIGLIPDKKSILTVSGNVYYHFGGTSRLSNRRPWYVRFGLTYFREEDEYAVDKYGFISLRIGRDLNITKKTGIDINAGNVWVLS